MMADEIKRKPTRVQTAQGSWYILSFQFRQQRAHQIGTVFLGHTPAPNCGQAIVFSVSAFYQPEIFIKNIISHLKQ